MLEEMFGSTLGSLVIRIWLFPHARKLRRSWTTEHDWTHKQEEIHGLTLWNDVCGCTSSEMRDPQSCAISDKHPLPAPNQRFERPLENVRHFF